MKQQYNMEHKFGYKLKDYICDGAESGRHALSCTPGATSHATQRMGLHPRLLRAPSSALQHRVRTRQRTRHGVIGVAWRATRGGRRRRRGEGRVGDDASYVPACKRASMASASLLCIGMLGDKYKRRRTAIEFTAAGPALPLLLPPPLKNIPLNELSVGQNQ